MSGLKLYSYWRSSAAFRVRIALNLKGVEHEIIPVDIKPGVSEQKGDAYLRLNPQGRVPALDLGDGTVIGQSMAMLDWLEETCPEPALLPADPVARARCRSFANAIACDIHPLNNLSVLGALKDDLGADEAQVSKWYAKWIQRGFVALEAVASSAKSDFLFGGYPSFAEICLVPQIWNARRFEVDLSAFPTLVALDRRCMEIEAFVLARPEAQPDKS